MFIHNKEIFRIGSLNYNLNNTVQEILDILDGSPVIEVVDGSNYQERVIGCVKNPTVTKGLKFFGDIWIHPDYFCENGYVVDGAEVMCSEYSPDERQMKIEEIFTFVRRGNKENED